jgi:hypothetical protein
VNGLPATGAALAAAARGLAAAGADPAAPGAAAAAPPGLVRLDRLTSREVGVWMQSGDGLVVHLGSRRIVRARLQ